MQLWLFGPQQAVNLAGSAFERVLRGHAGGRPAAPDPDAGRAAIELALRLASDGLAPVLHDVSDGGLAVAVAEICIRSHVGASVESDDWRNLFAEDPHRFVAAIRDEDAGAAASIAAGLEIDAHRIGTLGGETLTLGEINIPLADLTGRWRGAIRSLMAH
jgi:phosphoribosylformylglycinamidine synthase